MKRIVLILISIISIGCSSSKFTKNRTTKRLRNLITASPVFEKSFTGFSLFDPSKNKTLLSIHGNKYFTPASNIKILTLFTAISILGDTLPAFQYFTKKDSLFIIGTGDPTFLHTSFKNKALINFLQKSRKQQFYIPSKFEDKQLGPGWAWDDFNDYYQVEKSALPIYGNVATFNSENDPVVFPAYFKNNLQSTTKTKITQSVQRELSENNFVINQQFLASRKEKTIPFIYSDTLLLSLLNAFPNINIKIATGIPYKKHQLTTVYNTPKDTVLIRMMHQSDNFLAEQLLLMSSQKLFKEFNSKKIISFVKDSLLKNSPNQLNWRDGSGLSRYNLLSPNDLIYVLNKLKINLSQKKLFTYFPNSSNGTLENSYKNLGNSLYAKTGTMSNKHCLSGYLKCESGNVLIFSFMHNNYLGSSIPIRKEMSKILQYIIKNH